MCAFVAHAKCVGIFCFREGEGHCEDDPRYHRDDEEVCDGGELQVPRHLLQVLIERVEADDDEDDDNDQCDRNQAKDHGVEYLEGLTPTEIWLPRSQDPLREDEVDDVDDQDAGVDEDGRRDREGDVLRLHR